MRNKVAHYMSSVSRILVGLVFCFSGFVKVIDPLGTTYKIEDYLHAFGGVFSALDILAFPAAMCLITLEFVLGLSLLLHVKPRVTPWIVAAFMLVMTPLTLYLAIYNPVTDCGCFGDAIVISNWATFCKNIVLCLFTALIFADYKHSVPIFRSWLEWTILALLLCGSLAISIVCLRHLPIIDFRPYKVCTDIRSQMEIPDDAPHDVYKTTLIYEKEGRAQEFTIDDYPRGDSTWHFVDQKSELISKGYEPPIHDFQLVRSEDYEDITDDILDSEQRVTLLVMYDLEKADKKLLMRHLQELKAQYSNIYVLTGSSAQDIEKFEDEHRTALPFLLCDKIPLKTMVRANPGVVVLQKGVVVEKFNLRDVNK